MNIEGAADLYDWRHDQHDDLNIFTHYAEICWLGQPTHHNMSSAHCRNFTSKTTLLIALHFE